MTELQNDQGCIDQLMSMGCVQGAIDHFNWRYERYLTVASEAQYAEPLATWFRSKYGPQLAAHAAS